MSVELLDKTRKINRLLHNNHAQKVVFGDICDLLSKLTDSNVCIISNKGKVLGVCGSSTIESLFPKEFSRGIRIEQVLNERMLNVLSTKENFNLETLGFSKEEAACHEALVTPISISGERLGTLFLYRSKEPYEIDDIIISEYATTVVGLEMMRAVKEETESEERKKNVVASAVNTLSVLEKEAMVSVIEKLPQEGGALITSKVAQEVGITRSVIVNALRKLESAGVINTKSSGMKGTLIRIENEYIYEILHIKKRNS